MSYLSAQPDLIAAAATDLANIRLSIGAASAAAVGPTGGVLPAAADEVSTAAASLFNSYASEYQTLIGQASTFHDEFTQALAAGGLAYAGTEIANAAAGNAALNSITAPIQSLLGGGGTAAPAASNIVTLVMGASGYPIPSQLYINGIPVIYINPFWGAGTNIGLPTPEGLYPLTGVKDLTLDVSAARGVTILNDAIQAQLATPGVTQVNVFGYSQSATIASMEMAMLDPSNTPSSLPLRFTLVGDPSNPNGGLLARFPGLSLPSMGLTFGNATPDNSFPTRIYSIEYDGFADFPQYPLDLPADLNAFLGIVELHGGYPFLDPSQLVPPSQGGTAVQLTNTVGPTETQYFIVPTEHLPLLSPLRAIPGIGAPLADLIEPDVRVIVDLGYGSTTQGWSPDPPNVPTPFGVLPPVSAFDVAAALGAGTQHGVSAFMNDVSSAFSSPPNLSLSGLTSILGSGTGGSLLPSLAVPSSPQGFVTALQNANSNFFNAVSDSASAVYAVALPTADIANAFVTAVPSYDANLFLDGVLQAAGGDPVDGLIYAVGAPAAADTALATLAAGFEVRVVEHAAQVVYDDFTGTVPPSPG
ncbi:MAG: PE-PPE domain-containing protein [Mycobacterium sp.]|uniref:PE family protein n=1 Tax=Mycobacterium sp. TaxID=1785 RepID=UPI001EC4041A|nr:PE-PPE domain-containing protein [Mycobacterium sp.]MBW0019047.1 PE-PPE domain-containing protein [Mycobacterium sp.]